MEERRPPRPPEERYAKRKEVDIIWSYLGDSKRHVNDLFTRVSAIERALGLVPVVRTDTIVSQHIVKNGCCSTTEADSGAHQENQPM